MAGLQPDYLTQGELERTLRGLNGMPRPSLLAGLFVVVLCGCQTSTVTNATGITLEAPANAAALSAETDRQELVSACVRFIDTGQMSSVAQLGYAQRNSRGGVTFEKSVPIPLTALTPFIYEISLTYRTNNRGERVCRITHVGADRTSGTGVLVSDFVDSFQAKGWTVTRANVLESRDQRIDFRGQIQRQFGSSSSEVSFFRSP